MTTSTEPVTEESTSRFVQLPGSRVHYYEAGEGAPLVLLHGSGPGATGWSNFHLNIGPLAQHFRVLALDMPGWGGSDTQSEETGYDHSRDLMAFLDALELDRVVLVGNSMGGATALETSLRHPDRVERLITMGASFPGTNYFSPAGGFSEGLKILRAAYADPSPEAMERLVSIMCFDSGWATPELSRMRSEAALRRPDHLASYLAKPSPQPSYRQIPTEEFRSIAAPTLAIHGRDDRVVPLEHSLRIVSTVPDSRLLVINRCGHWVQIEHAEEFNRVVIDFAGIS